MSARPRISGLLHDRGGSTALEFAMLAPVLVLAIVILIEGAGLVLAQGMLDTAAQRAARAGATGWTPAGVARDDYVRSVAGEGLPAAGGLGLTAEAFANPAGLGGPAPGAAGMGGPRDVVLYTLTWAWRGLTPLMHGLVGDVTLTARVAVRNEPY